MVMHVRALSLKENDFRFVSLPAIVHWQFNHFIIVERWSTKSVEVVDPAQGRRRLSAQEFDDGFTGVVLMLEPSAYFQRKNKQAKLTLGTYVRSYLQQAPWLCSRYCGFTALTSSRTGYSSFSRDCHRSNYPFEDGQRLRSLWLGMISRTCPVGHQIVACLGY